MIKRLSFAVVVLLSGILLFVEISCKKNSSEDNFLKFQIGNESFSMDSISAFMDTSSSQDFTGIYIEARDTKTGNGIGLICFSFPKGAIAGTYVFESSLPYPLPSPYKQLVDVNIRINTGRYTGSYTIAQFRVGDGSDLVVESIDKQTLKGTFLATLDPPLNPGQGGALQYLQLAGRFNVLYYFWH